MVSNLEKSTVSVRIESIDLEDWKVRFRDEYCEEHKRFELARAS
jgi:phenylpyruvate tautomerase PptA (4-oxalocrotonate tautomerase family)